MKMKSRFPGTVRDGPMVGSAGERDYSAAEGGTSTIVPPERDKTAPTMDGIPFPNEKGGADNIPPLPFGQGMMKGMKKTGLNFGAGMTSNSRQGAD